MNCLTKLKSGPLHICTNVVFKNLKIQVGTDENSKDAIYVMNASKATFEYCHLVSPCNTVLYALNENTQIYLYGCVLDGKKKSARFLSLDRYFLNTYTT